MAPLESGCITVSFLLVTSWILTSSAVSETLIGSREPCTNEGREVSVHSIKDMRCFTCMCKNGFVECQREACPSQQGCFMLLEQERDQCCQHCKGCVWEGVEHLSGSEWTKDGEPCRIFKCLGGVVTETKVVCHTPCQSPIPPREGECCPACKGCLINGQEVGVEREATIPDDPCLKCHCREGLPGERRLTCSKAACPVLQCPPTRQTRNPGDCCPTCKGSRPLRVPPRNRCVLVSEVRQERELFSQAVSHPTAPLLSSSASSSPPPTPPPHPQPASPIPLLLADGRSNNNTKGLTKQVGGADGGLSPGNCTQCRCGGNGTVHCLRETCPVLECPLERRVWPIVIGEDGAKRRACCMKCLEDKAEARRQCVQDGVVYKEGERRALDACRSCVCQSGMVRCAVEVCTGAGAVVVTSKGLLHHAAPSAASPNAERNTACPPNTRLYHPNGTCCPTCVERDGVCSVFGDPHYRTFDGRFYSFQGACKYLLASDQCSALLSVNGSSVGKPGMQSSKGTFSIRVTNDARGTFSSSWTKTISVKAHGLKLSLGQKMRVKLNGKRADLPLTIPLNASARNASLPKASPLPPTQFLSPAFQSLLLSVRRDNGGIVLWLHPGIVIIWDGSSFLEVSVPTSYKNKLCGLCGNYNDDPKDDLTPRPGSRSVQQPAAKPSKANQGEKAGAKKFGNSAPNHARGLGGGNLATAFASSWRVGGRKACSRSEDSDVRWPIEGKHLKTGHGGLPSRRPFPPLLPSWAPHGVQTAVWGVSTMCRGGPTVGPQGSLERRRRKMRERYHKCRTLRSEVFSACHDKVNPNMYIRSCLSDLCECPKGARCHCSSLKAYAHACRRSLQSLEDDTSSSPFSLPQEIQNWRNQTGCQEDSALTSATTSGEATSSSSEEEEDEEEEERRRRLRRMRKRRRRRRRKRKRLQQQLLQGRRRQNGGRDKLAAGAAGDHVA